MKNISPILLSLAGSLLLLSQIKSSQPPNKNLRLHGIEQNLSDEIVRAQKSVLSQRDALRIAKASAASSPATVAAAEKSLDTARTAATNLSKQAAPPAAVAAVVDASSQTQLIQEASDLFNEVNPMAQSAARWQASFVWASLVLGFLSAVFASFSWNRTSAAFSAAVVLASGAPNLYPVNQRAVYYQTLANHARSLTSALTLASQLTVAEYDNDVRYETALSAAIPFPGTSGGDPTEQLLDTLDAAKIPAQ